MVFILTVTGKGGSGKSTISALLLFAFKKLVKGPILVVDADPNTNLNEVIGVGVVDTVGNIREKFQAESSKLPFSMSREEQLEYLIRSILTESEDFDFLAMGRPEGPGCYCYVNHLLRKVLAMLSKDYKLVLIDAEAGLEQLSRRTVQNVDLLIAVTDPSMRSVHTAKRIADLANELEIKVKDVQVVVNRVRDVDTFMQVKQVLEKLKLKTLGYVPEDPLIAQYDLNGIPLSKLPSDSVAFKAVEEIAKLIAESYSI
ncbi:MAG: ATP-binding protein [Candidatus Methanomethylicota archaeon]|uniref:ATP-binding protein n=1 Tax=Thermoproteota archaeon TaxID=2056631 RepID=A0A497ES87_9CREN|nr:MAG: ATP-binding protein [Candidatus Verstraetearchaeota archaeon]